MEKPLIGLEPPSSKGSASARPRSLLDASFTRYWLPADHFRSPVICPDCLEPPLRRSLRLWLHFSVKVVFTIGLAIKHGPEIFLPDFSGKKASPMDVRAPYKPSGQSPALDGKERPQAKDESTRTSQTLDSNVDSGYDETIT